MDRSVSAYLLIVKGSVPLGFAVIVAYFLAQDPHGPDQHSFFQIDPRRFPHHGQKRFLYQILSVLRIVDPHR
jgi:hypothetical protein